jgi:isoleucyl-tRNA synthetase
VRTTAKPGWAAAEGPRAVVVVAKDLTPALVAEGLVREVVHAVQTRRKALDLEFTDRIELAFATPSDELRAALEAHLDYVAAETLAAAASVAAEGTAGEGAEPLEIDGHPLAIKVSATKSG